MDSWSSTYDHRRSLGRSRGRSLDHRSIARSLGRPIARSLGRSAARSLGRSVPRSLVRSVARSLDHSPDRSIARSPGPSLDRSIARSIDRSIAWTECRLKNSTLGIAEITRDVKERRGRSGVGEWCWAGGGGGGEVCGGR